MEASVVQEFRRPLKSPLPGRPHQSRQGWFYLPQKVNTQHPGRIRRGLLMSRAPCEDRQDPKFFVDQGCTRADSRCDPRPHFCLSGQAQARASSISSRGSSAERRDSMGGAFCVLGCPWSQPAKTVWGGAQGSAPGSPQDKGHFMLDFILEGAGRQIFPDDPGVVS